MENMTPKRPEAHLPEPWLRGPIPGCLTDLGKSVPRQPLPGGRGSVSDCKHTALNRAATARERLAAQRPRNPQIS